MWNSAEYTTSSWIFIRLLGAIFFIAIGAFFLQVKGLIGSKGILPLKEYIFFLKKRLVRKSYKRLPMIYWFSQSDRFIQGSLLLGLLAAVLLMLGIIPPLMLLTLYVIYLSLVYAGQDFMSFGWELFLLEITAHAFFLSFSTIPNPMVFLSLNFLLFRFNLQAGAVKLQSQDVNWRNLKAIYYHYQSQPLPNTQSWFVYKLPMGFHKLACLYMFFVEFIVPFGIFFNDDIRFFVFTQIFLLQFFIWFTGNFSYLNYMTVVLSVILIPDKFLPEFLRGTAGALPTPLPLDAFLYAAGTGLFALQAISLANHFFPKKEFRRILNVFSPFFLGNRYGIFAVMTTQRIEIVIEGSDDGTTWKEYAFKYKPSEVARRPRRISPYQPRLDWQAWFLPFSSFEQEPWFQSFLFSLLNGDKDVLALLRVNPFPGRPPRLIRALAYDYEFTSWKEKKETGAWWRRKLMGAYSPTLTKKT